MTRQRWLAALMVVGALWSGPGARASIPVPIDGACVAGVPQIQGPPGAEWRLQAAGASVGCGPGGELLITYPARPVLPPPGGVPDLRERLRPIPPDFGGWVYLWVNGRPLRMPLRHPVTGAFEPDAYLVQSTNRTVMPIRFFTEAIGGQVEWQQAGAVAVLRYGGREVRLAIGSREARVDGRPVALDQPAFLWLDRTMIPTRFLMEAFGANVRWDPLHNAVWVDLPGAVCMDDGSCGPARGGDLW